MARHTQMHVKDAAIEMNENLLAAAANALNGSAREPFGGGGEIGASYAMRKDLRMQNGMSDDVRRNGADNRFDFGKFRHGG